MRIVFLLVLIVSAGCSTVRVRTNYDSKHDFSSYQTFCWLKGCEWVFEGPDELFDSARIEFLKQSIVDELGIKGYIQDENNPDFLVDFHIVVSQEDTLLSQYSFSGDVYPTSWYPFSEEEAYQYIEGSLVIDVSDSHTSAMVWRSDTQGYMERDSEVSPDRMRATVQKALRKFPARSRDK